jgi:hypothetical protein
VRKEGCWCEVLEMGGVIGHGIECSWDEVMLWIVAVLAPMEGLEAQEVGCRLGSSGGLFTVPVDRGCVVMEGEDGCSRDVCGMSYHVVLANACSKFEITVGYGALGILVRDEVACHVRCEGGTPDVGVPDWMLGS